MKKNILLSLLLALAALPMAGFGQSFILFEEDFENTPSSFTLNTDGIAGAPIGTNTWIINDEYDGFPLYPETPNQDSVLSGTIGGAPFSNYLHIHDANSFPGVANANYDPSNASDNFVELTSGFCTQGMTNITFAFFYICEGTVDDYGELYYSADGDPWTQVGLTKYNNTDKWKYLSLIHI